MSVTLCKPALVYLIISSVAIVVILFQNIGTRNMYCLGSLSCDVPSVTIIFAIKILYIVFWTWILNLICKSGATKVAWFLVLLPFILFFILLLFMITSLL